MTKILLALSFLSLLFIHQGESLEADAFEVITHVERLKSRQRKEVVLQEKDHSTDESVEYLLQTNNAKYNLLLKPAKHFIGPDLHKSFQDDWEDDCHFQGRVLQNNGSVVISTCDGRLNGMMKDGHNGATYYIEYKPDRQQNIIMDSRNLKKPDRIIQHAPEMIYTEPNPHDVTKDYLNRVRRETSLDMSERTKYVAMAFVLDKHAFMKLNSNKKDAIRFVLSVFNHIDFIFCQANVRIILTNLEIWTGENQIKIDAQTGQNLERFGQYSKNVLKKKDGWEYDNAHLLTGYDQVGGVVGLGAVGSLCADHGQSHAITELWSMNAMVTAGTVGHEFGHNFGMHHIHDQCKCSNPPCLMTSGANWSPVQGLADCSIRQLQERCKMGRCTCLADKPKDSYMGAICGNGFVESGEECDCGTPEYCQNKCCDPNTCKLKSFAECADGECCSSECKVMKKGKVCRKSKGECDIDEKCNGKSKLCLIDVHMQDFTDCKSKQSYCHKGKCVPTLDNQCEKLWGKGALHLGHCSRNYVGDKFGNCGKNKDGSPIKCNTGHEFCGKVQCHGPITNRFILFGSSRSTTLYGSGCRSGTTYVGRGIRDPTLALHGTKCGEQMVCHDEKCIDVAMKTGLSSCNDACYYGKCTSVGACLCPAGYRCPDCLIPDPTIKEARVCNAPPKKTERHSDGGLIQAITECDDPASMNLTRVGCHEQAGTFLHSYRGRMNWRNPTTSFMQITCNCAKLVKDLGFKAFGVVYWGECWGFTSQEDAITRPKSTGCQNDKYATCGEKDEICIGTKGSAFVHLL